MPSTHGSLRPRASRSHGIGQRVGSPKGKRVFGYTTSVGKRLMLIASGSASVSRLKRNGKRPRGEAWIENGSHGATRIRAWAAKVIPKAMQAAAATVWRT